ncbi:long-chain-fatty-acid--CoA ligase [Frankia sp. AgB32]|uniref:long-chain-fatty-acid--CoA ligase n=1 Tax=Frankia sp. AgB32 TaxID=631119 RepID=UPI00200BBA2E|nr:long-chain-fatty-acid--CoA ligase [Frankia sp. AgB32]MCK9893746.1 long-chain-fatty-acid--CoA ligase [Frankia sp. AgB32]
MVYLLDAVSRAARESGSIIFLVRGEARQVAWTELYEDAARLAAGLIVRGVGPGRPLVILALTSRAAVTAALAGWLSGASVTFAPTPARTMTAEVYLAATRERLAALGTQLLLVGQPWVQDMAALRVPGRTVADLDVFVAKAIAQGERTCQPPDISEDDPAILQMTSGTTDTPRIVTISHRNLAANIQAIKTATGHDEIHGRMLSWLPLSHDMGLVGGLIIPMSCGGCDTVLSSPVDYLARPEDWMRQLSRFQATATVAPNSAYSLAARLLSTGPALDLSSLKIALSGGEAIDPEAVEAFVKAGARHGMSPAVPVTAYGLAEATVAVTMSPVRRGLRCDPVDGAALAEQARAVPVAPGASSTRARRLPLLGPPIPGMSVRVVESESGRVLPERSVGEIEVRGPSVAVGYRKGPTAMEFATGRDGWLRTGDLGYLVDSELVVTGRRKDVIIVAGRNIYPEEVERAATLVAEVRAGNAVAFSYRRLGPLSGECLGIAVESRSESIAEIQRKIVLEVRENVGVRPHIVRVLPPGSIPKTPSGKLQRAEAARMYAP